MNDSSFLSLAYKRLYIWKEMEPPSRQTRINDGIAAPSKKAFKQAYKAAQTTKQMDSKSRSHMLEVLNRTINTPALLWRMRVQFTTPLCPRGCGVIADAEHIQVECLPGHMITDIIMSFFNTKYPQARIRRKHIQFHTPRPKMGKSANGQYLHLLATVSKTLFALPFDSKFPEWHPIHFAAKLLTTISVLKLVRLNAKWDYGVIAEFLDFYRERIEHLEEYMYDEQTKLHFRRNPRRIEDIRRTRAPSPPPGDE